MEPKIICMPLTEDLQDSSQLPEEGSQELWQHLKIRWPLKNHLALISSSRKYTPISGQPLQRAARNPLSLARRWRAYCPFRLLASRRWGHTSLLLLVIMISVFLFCCWIYDSSFSLRLPYCQWEQLACAWKRQRSDTGNSTDGGAGALLAVWSCHV